MYILHTKVSQRMYILHTKVIVQLYVHMSYLRLLYVHITTKVSQCMYHTKVSQHMYIQNIIYKLVKYVSTAHVLVTMVSTADMEC